MKEKPHRVFSLKYRPATFEDLVGQAHVRQTLVNTLLRRQVGHGYLFSGPRGVGKTTAARLFAKALNCAEGPGPKICCACDACREIAGGNCLDVIEMDGASNRKIEDVRTLRENVRFAPASCRYKIYIIDEVHMLTQEAFNALLKTLEEPPEHVVFILATTDPQKIPETIHSRCQELEFHRISNPDLSKLIETVCKREKITCDAEAASKLADWADGSARDALVALEQAAAYCDGTVREESVDRLFGWVDRKTTASALEAVAREDRKAIFALAQKIESDGKDIAYFFIQLARELRVAWENQIDGKSDSPSPKPDISPDALLRMISALLEAERNLRRTRQPGLFLAIQLVELIDLKRAVPISEIVRRIEDMESRVSSGKSVEPEKRRDAESVVDVAVVWEKLLERVTSKSPQLGEYLREGRPGRISGQILPVRFPAGRSLARQRVSDEKNAAAIDAVLSEILGRPGWRVQSVADQPESAGVPGGSKDVPLRVRAASDLFESKGARRRE